MTQYKHLWLLYSHKHIVLFFLKNCKAYGSFKKLYKRLKFLKVHIPKENGAQWFY